MSTHARSCSASRAGDLAFGSVVREAEFDGAESRARGFGEALEEWHFGEEKGEIRGKFRHASRCPGRRNGRVAAEFLAPSRRGQGAAVTSAGTRSPAAKARVAKLQRTGNRSSAGPAVDKPVNRRWNVREYAANGIAIGCFCCRFLDPFLCIK
jgi:hypothetical protein